MKKIVSVIILTFTVLEISLFLAVEHAEKKNLQEHMRSELNSINNAYQLSIRSARDISKILFKLMIYNKDILPLFASAQNADEAQRAVIRKELYDRLKDMYREQQSVGLKQLHFHLPDSTSFLRMHKPSEFGDSIRGVRPTVDIANKYHKYVEGFEEGRIYNGFRFVYPLEYQGRHIGSVEMSIGATYLANNMNSIEPGIHDFIIKKSVVVSKVFTAEQYNYAPSGLSDRYLREVTSYDFLNRKNSVFSGTQEYLNALRLMSPLVDKKLEQGAPFAVHYVVNGKEITSAFLPVYNIKKANVAYFINTYVDEKYHHIMYMANLVIISVSVTLLLIFATIYLVLMNMNKTKRLAAALDEKLHEHKEQLKFKEEILFQQSKLATLGEMFSALAHQWKQPLNILAMYIQSLIDDEENMPKEEFEKRMQIVEKCMAQINYMSETINDFMDFIRPADTSETKMDTVRIAEDIVKLLKPSMDKKKIEMIIDRGGCRRLYAQANGNEIKHVLVNIINNAKDAIMDIKKTDRTFIGCIKIAFSKTENDCIVTISDNGGGISREIIEHIFMPYVSTKQHKDGSGLGLYMCSNIIKKYNGSLRVENADSGAVFTISIPLVQDQSQQD